MEIPLSLIFKLSILLPLLYLDLSSAVSEPWRPSSICEGGTIIWKGTCLNASYVTSSDININDICAMYPSYCRNKLRYYFECPEMYGTLQNPLLVDGMCVDRIIAQCPQGLQRSNGGICSHGPIRRSFMYTLDMSSLDFPTENEYQRMRNGRKRRDKLNYPVNSIMVQPMVVVVPPTHDPTGIQSQSNFLKNFHYFKYMYPGMKKIRVQIVESPEESRKSVNYDVDPLVRWLGTSPRWNPYNSGGPNILRYTTPTFVQDPNVFWEISNVYVLGMDPEMPLAQHMKVDQPIIIPL